MSVVSDEIRELYNQGLSASAIAGRNGLTIWSVYSIMKRHSIPRRKPEETNELMFRKKEKSFKVDECKSIFLQKLKVAGLMLYLSEGSKRTDKTVDLANSDVEMIRLFLNFLRKIYHVDENRLRILLYCYSNQDPMRLIDFWSGRTRIPEKQFTKPYIRDDYRRDKEGRMVYGLVHVRYSDKRLIEQILSDISNLNHFLLG